MLDVSSRPDSRGWIANQKANYRRWLWKTCTVLWPHLLVSWVWWRNRRRVFLSICFDDFTMFSQYFVSRTGHGFLSICRVCIPSELVRFHGDLGGFFCCRSRIASFQFRSCSGIQHVLMGATKPRNGAADCRRNTTETLLRSNLYRLQQRVFPLCSALRLSSQTFIFLFASQLEAGTGKF